VGWPDGFTHGLAGARGPLSCPTPLTRRATRTRGWLLGTCSVLGHPPSRGRDPLAPRERELEPPEAKKAASNLPSGSARSYGRSCVYVRGARSPNKTIEHVESTCPAGARTRPTARWRGRGRQRYFGERGHPGAGGLTCSQEVRRPQPEGCKWALRGALAWGFDCLRTATGWVMMCRSSAGGGGVGATVLRTSTHRARAAAPLRPDARHGRAPVRSWWPRCPFSAGDRDSPTVSALPGARLNLGMGSAAVRIKRSFSMPVDHSTVEIARPGWVWCTRYTTGLSILGGTERWLYGSENYRTGFNWGLMRALAQPG